MEVTDKNGVQFWVMLQGESGMERLIAAIEERNGVKRSVETGAVWNSTYFEYMKPPVDDPPIEA
jgi:hypothetical protein